ncbi:MAG TPA: methionine synthase [Methanoregulaceae archaeon]|nr:methionine synthase [Methanoregulaceae archaeon]
MSNRPGFGVLLPTTVVGSYPVVKGRDLRSLFDPLHFSVKVAVGDQIAAGIDIISDGQVRGTMIESFTAKIPGVRGQDVIGKVQPAPGPLTAGDVKYALSKSKMVKGIITGPSSIAYGLHIATPVYRDRGELVLDLASVLAQEAKILSGLGITILQIDEPIFSTGVADIGLGRQAIDMITQRTGIPTAMHVCGDISGIIDELLKFPVDILDFEFSRNSKNLGLFGSRELAGKMIGFGCVDSTTEDIESIEEIRTRIEHGIEVFDPGSMLIDPDCGLRMRSRTAASAKLTHMVEAVKQVRREIS